MVVAKFTMDEKRKLVKLTVKGHAGANNSGHDLVCAAVSILATTLAQNVKMAEARDSLKYKPTIKLKQSSLAGQRTKMHIQKCFTLTLLFRLGISCLHITIPVMSQ